MTYMRFLQSSRLPSGRVVTDSQLMVRPSRVNTWCRTTGTEIREITPYTSESRGNKSSLTKLQIWERKKLFCHYGLFSSFLLLNRMVVCNDVPSANALFVSQMSSPREIHPLCCFLYTHAPFIQVCAGLNLYTYVYEYIWIPYGT